MRSKVWQKRALFFLLIVYCVDVVWTLAHLGNESSGDRIFPAALVGAILYLHLKLKTLPKAPSMLTKKMRDASLRSIRIIHIVFLGAIAIYALLAERLARPVAQAPALLVGNLWTLAALMVVIAYAVRRKLLPSVTDSLRRGAADVTALGRWRMANILSMVLIMSIALYGVALRVMGGNRRVVWPLFIAAAALMLLWRPRLDDTGIENIQA